MAGEPVSTHRHCPFLVVPSPCPGLFTQSCLLPFQVTKALWGHQDPKVRCCCSDIPIIA